MITGRMRRRVTIQEKTVTRGSTGEELVTWSTVATVWAAVEPLNGREYLESRQTQANVDTRVTIRYRSGMEPTMRLLTSDSRILHIESVIHKNERFRELVIMCREEVE